MVTFPGSNQHQQVLLRPRHLRDQEDEDIQQEHQPPPRPPRLRDRKGQSAVSDHGQDQRDLHLKTCTFSECFRLPKSSFQIF